ncbi:MAG: response regulator transcription factor [Rhodopirellula sp.]|nr:response regulator transcription factor [Rhodopirellula sp.]
MLTDSASDKQTVFVIDDDEAVRESIAALVDIRGLPVETFASAEDFLATYSGVEPGCVITDLRIEHGMTGLELQVALRERGYGIPVIVISAYANVATAVQAMHNGAVTLLEKNCSSDELWKAIVEALATDSDRRILLLQQKSLIQRFEQLKTEELVVLQGVINGQLNKVIAKELSISLRTVETRRHNVLDKVGVASLPELVRLYVELEQAIGQPPGPYLMDRANSQQ